MVVLSLLICKLMILLYMQLPKRLLTGGMREYDWCAVSQRLVVEYLVVISRSLKCASFMNEL